MNNLSYVLHHCTIIVIFSSRFIFFFGCQKAVVCVLVLNFVYAGQQTNADVWVCLSTGRGTEGRGIYTPGGGGRISGRISRQLRSFALFYLFCILLGVYFLRTLVRSSFRHRFVISGGTCVCASVPVCECALNVKPFSKIVWQRPQNFARCPGH